MSLETETAERPPQDAGQGKGSFIWYELATPDPNAAAVFYAGVVGWRAAAFHEGADYTILHAGERGVAGVMAMPELRLQNGGKPGWIGYVGVADVDAANARVADAGGKVYFGPADIPNVGRFSVVADPGGALFALMTPSTTEAPPPLAPHTTGTIGWHELHAAQGGEAALAFYAHHFGWSPEGDMDMGAMGKYRFFADGGAPIGAVMDKPPQMPAGAWQFYFIVDAIDAAIERVKAGGGTLTMGPVEVPGGSWIIQAIDPQGVNFALVAPKR